MRGRFTQTFGRAVLGLCSAPLNLRPRYNVAAGQEATVRSCGSGRRRRLSMPRWDLVPGRVYLPALLGGRVP